MGYAGTITIDNNNVNLVIVNCSVQIKYSLFGKR